MDIALRRLLPTFWFQRSIGVIGSAHVDILGKSKDHVDRLDKIGEVEMHLGGSAYNIAVNLGRENQKVRLWTVLKRGSLVEKWVLSKLRREGVLTSSLTRRRNVAAGAFLATVHDNDYISAITYVGVDQVELPIGKIRSLIKRASVVVSDCNLSADQLCEVIKASNEFGKPLVISGVSESKVLRFVNAMGLCPGASAFALVTDTRIFASLQKFVTESAPQGGDLVERLNVSLIAIFDGVKQNTSQTGYLASTRFLFPGGRVETVEDTLPGQATKTGGRDATAAGLAKLRLLSKVDLTADNIVSEFRKYAWPLVCRILRAGGPTLGALEHEVSIANFGIETAPIARHVIVIRSIQTVLTRAAQAVTALLAALAAATQVFPERMQPVLDWLWTTLFGGTVP